MSGDRSPAGGIPPVQLARVVGLWGAVWMGLGSILGTGVFVSIGLAAEATGPSVVLAVALAAVVATFNGLSSAQLAANHPVSGGTYEYGYRFLNPTLGFTAGFMFLCAKSASAATAALGFAGYLLLAIGASPAHRVVAALLGVAVLTAVVAGGIRRSNRANAAIVTLTLVALLTFVAVGCPAAVNGAALRFDDLWLDGGQGGHAVTNFLRATALMFVAFTGYGRIATLGEEVYDPRRTIPRAMIVTLVVAATLYALVAFVAVAAVGSERLAQVTEQASAPLAVIAGGFGAPWLPGLIVVGASAAMLGVLLNLLLGLSRVVLAMARRGDMPAVFARVDKRHASPVAAVLLVGAVIAALTAMGSIKTAWSFSAFTVLVYYALTNLSALRLPPAARLYPQAVPAAGLVGCLGLCFFVEPAVWIAGIALLGIGLLWHAVARRVQP